MAADYTRTIVFKVEDQAIKRATGQIVASLKKIEKTLEKIEKKAFTQLVTDSGKVADNIDRATRALNKYNSELRKAQTQNKLPAPGGALAVREKGGALARTGGGAKRGGFPWGGAIRGGGNLLGVGGTAVAASTIAINAANKQWNNMIGTINKATSLIPGVGDKFHIVEAKVNGLSITLHALGDLVRAHPLLSAATAALVFGVGVNVKSVTTAVMGLKDALGATGKGMSNLLRTAKNTSRGIKESLVGTFAGVSGSYGGPVDKGFVSGKGYGLGLRQFLKPAKDATVDVFDIGKRSPYSKYDFKYGDLPYVDREAAERQRFMDVARARGLDPRQKMGLKARIRSNVEASRVSRSASGFGEWTAHINGSKRANKLLTEKQKILKAISRQNIKLGRQGKAQIKIEDVLNKKARERLGIKEKEGEWSFGDRRKGMFTREARFDRRERATQRLNRRKQGRFAERTGMNPKQAENLMLGFGFPMLFGGGIGAVGGGVGGAALGNMIGMPGFGLQIMGSAIGTQLENLVMKANELGKALEEVDMTALEASGVKVSANLAEQVNDLKRIGKATEARYLLEKEAFRQTGAWPSANRNIKSTIDDLGNSWNRVSTTIGTALGTLSGPFLGTLGSILDVVNEIAKVFNVVATTGDKMANDIFKLFGLEEAIATAKYEQSDEGKKALKEAKDKLAVTKEQLKADAKIRDMINAKSLGDTYGDRLGNINKDYAIAIEKIRDTQAAEKAAMVKDRRPGFVGSKAYFKELDVIDTVAAGKIADAKNTRDQATRKEVASYEADVNKQIEDYTRQSDLLQSQLGIKKEINEQTRKGNEYAAGQLQYDLQAIELKHQTKILLEDHEDIRVRSAVLILNALRLEELSLQKTNQLTEAEKQLEAVFDSIGVSIRDGLVEGINAAIDGTKTLGEVASNVFKRISNALLNYGVNVGLSSLPGVGDFFKRALGMEGMAKGGPVSGGTPYVVGEKGPELFVPGSSGNIVPNHAMGGANVVVNVDASGSSVEGDAGQAEQLGSMLAAAVQAEIANQQRPGGLLARR